MAVTPAVRRRVLERAGHECEYCRIRGWPLTVDHIVPRATAAPPAPGAAVLPRDIDHVDNLAAACFPCNRGKWNVTSGPDPETGTEPPLFNPRRQRWAEHFAWRDDCILVVGLTSTGRATVNRLHLNRPLYQRQRRLLRAAMRAGEPAWP